MMVSCRVSRAKTQRRLRGINANSMTNLSVNNRLARVNKRVQAQMRRRSETMDRLRGQLDTNNKNISEFND